MRDALEHVSEREREMLLMRHAGFSYREVAEAVEVAPSSVGTLLARTAGRTVDGGASRGGSRGGLHRCSQRPVDATECPRDHASGHRLGTHPVKGWDGEMTPLADDLPTRQLEAEPPPLARLPMGRGWRSPCPGKGGPDQFLFFRRGMTLRVHLVLL